MTTHQGACTPSCSMMLPRFFMYCGSTSKTSGAAHCLCNSVVCYSVAYLVDALLQGVSAHHQKTRNLHSVARHARQPSAIMHGPFMGIRPAEHQVVVY